MLDEEVAYATQRGIVDDGCVDDFHVETLRHRQQGLSDLAGGRFRSHADQPRRMSRVVRRGRRMRPSPRQIEYDMIVARRRSLDEKA